jgi:hypothetical protein
MLIYLLGVTIEELVGMFLGEIELFKPVGDRSYFEFENGFWWLI